MPKTAPTPKPAPLISLHGLSAGRYEIRHLGAPIGVLERLAPNMQTWIANLDRGCDLATLPPGLRRFSQRFITLNEAKTIMGVARVESFAQQDRAPAPA